MAVDVNRHIGDLEKSRDSLDAVSHHGTAHVVRVVMRGQHTGHGHAVSRGYFQQILDCIRRIDHEALAGRAIADQIDEIGHLAGQRIAGGEVHPGLELAEVQGFVHDDRLTIRSFVDPTVGWANVSIVPTDYAGRVSTPSPLDQDRSGRLTSLEAGQRIPYGGCHWVEVSPDLAAAFGAGDHLVVVQETGDLLHIPQPVVALTEQAVAAARQGFVALQGSSSSAISGFFESFARRLEDESVFSTIAAANAVDVEKARERGRSTTRLILDAKMRRSMVEALRMWRDVPDGRDRSVDLVDHGASGSPWTVDERRAPLGVVGFVFEGRPNVFADATGVLRSGNSVVFRIGSDALGTARQMMESALVPALVENGLPPGSVVLLDSPERSAGHALFAHSGLSLAVARGSGEAVAQLGAVARQSGVPVSLHGTGGAWMVVTPSASPMRVRDCVETSLDRKVCNTLNVCCVPSDRVDLLDAVLSGAVDAADRRDSVLRLHAVGDGAFDALSDSWSRIGRSGSLEIVNETDDAVLATEWEWDERPELSIRLVKNWRDGTVLFNRWSPQFIVAVLTADEADVDEVYRLSNAPFVGDGFTRWVDGQYALNRPELGLSNWQSGRLFARGGILSGDGVYSVRYLARHQDSSQRR